VTSASIPASLYNAVVNGGNLSILILGNYNVAANQCEPEPSFVAVRLDYQRPETVTTTVCSMSVISAT